MALSRFVCASVMLAAWLGRCHAQLPRVRDSAGVRIVSNAAPILDTNSWRVVEPAPIVALGGPGAKGNADLGIVSGALRLMDGNVVVAEFDHDRVAFFKPDGGYRFGIDVVGISGREGPSNLFTMAGGTVVEWDGVANRLMQLSRRGSVLQTRRVENPPDIRSKLPRGGWERPFLSILGAFASGEMIGTTHNQLLPQNRQTDIDTIVVYHVDRKGKLTELGPFFGAERFGFAMHYSVAGQTPLGQIGSIAVDDDWWYYTDGSAFEIQQRAPTGRLLGLIRIGRERGSVTPELLRRLKRARLQRSDPVLRHDDSLALEWIRFPPREPAYTALKVDDAHRLWARMWAVTGDPATWDVFDRSGRFLGTTVMPGDLEVLQIANGYLVARYTYHPNESEVRVYKLAPER